MCFINTQLAAVLRFTAYHPPPATHCRLAQKHAVDSSASALYGDPNGWIPAIRGVDARNRPLRRSACASRSSEQSRIHRLVSGTLPPTTRSRVSSAPAVYEKARQSPPPSFKCFLASLRLPRGRGLSLVARLRCRLARGLATDTLERRGLYGNESELLNGWPRSTRSLLQWKRSVTQREGCVLDSHSFRLPRRPSPSVRLLCCPLNTLSRGTVASSLLPPRAAVLIAEDVHLVRPRLVPIGRCGTPLGRVDHRFARGAGVGSETPLASWVLRVVHL